MTRQLTGLGVGEEKEKPNNDAKYVLISGLKLSYNDITRMESLPWNGKASWIKPASESRIFYIGEWYILVR